MDAIAEPKPQRTKFAFYSKVVQAQLVVVGTAIGGMIDACTTVYPEGVKPSSTIYIMGGVTILGAILTVIGRVVARGGLTMKAGVSDGGEQ